MNANVKSNDSPGFEECKRIIRNLLWKEKNLENELKKIRQLKLKIAFELAKGLPVDFPVDE